MRSHDKRALCAEVCHVYFSCTVAIQLLIFSSHVRMLIYLPALNLKLSVALSTPIIANYLLQPEAMCRLASSNQTLLFSRQGCEVHQKQHSNSLNIPSCHCIWVKVTVLCQAPGREVRGAEFSGVGKSLSVKWLLHSIFLLCFVTSFVRSSA